MPNTTKEGYYDESLTFDGIQKTIDKLATDYSKDAGIITTIGKHGSLLAILHSDIKEQNRLTGIQNNRLEILSWVVGICTLITTIVTLMNSCLN